jgi:hypothetical protein
MLYGMDVAFTYERILSSKGSKEISGIFFEQRAQLPALFPTLQLVLDV